MKTDFKLYLKTLIPNLIRNINYVRGGQMLQDASIDHDRSFGEFMTYCGNEHYKCLQIGARGSKFGKNWTSVDLFDRSPIIDFNYDIRDLKFPDESFDGVMCSAILEHVDNPVKAISELFRVLKHGGKILVDVPFNQPYHPSPNDYWRVTPEGMRIWMHQFKALSCGGYFINKSCIYTNVYFYGEKP